MVRAVARWLWLGALASIACAPAQQTRARPRVVVVVRSRAPTPAPAPQLDEQLSLARAELADGELAAERIERVDGEARVHLVLEHGRCYRVWIGAEVPLAVRLEDEHGHVLAERSGEPAWLDEVCPRWSGSFALVVDAGDTAARAAVLVGARDR